MSSDIGVDPAGSWGTAWGRLASREVRLSSRPSGAPTPGDFALVTIELPPPALGQVLVRNLYMSVDPYVRMRGRTGDPESYVPPFQVGESLDGPAVGEVVESRADGLLPGDLVLHGYGWRDQVVLDAGRVRRVERIDGVSPSAYLGPLGIPALTAYAGLLDVAELQPGDAVFVSGASGATGGMAGQIARLKGASRVIGSAGSDAKVAYLVERLGFDAAFNYRHGAIADQLGEAAPHGIDVYFDNAGGDQLEAAIGALNIHGRVALCGAIAVYSATEPIAGPRNLPLAIGKRLTLRGFSVRDYAHRMPDMIADVGRWLRSGRIVADETIVHGLEFAPEAFVGLVRGENTGRMIVRMRSSA
ncbi:MAG TPA: NADP-dependent oxidoreductase [Thermopolyspora sp.]|jgi:Putative NADP-dependent oxidoreductases